MFPNEAVDPSDRAIIGGLKKASQLQAYQVKHFIFFAPVSKRTEADIQSADDKTFKTSKGAPSVILDLAHNKSAIEPSAARIPQSQLLERQ